MDSHNKGGDGPLSPTGANKRGESGQKREHDTLGSKESRDDADGTVVAEMNQLAERSSVFELTFLRADPGGGKQNLLLTIGVKARKSLILDKNHDTSWISKIPYLSAIVEQANAKFPQPAPPPNNTIDPSLPMRAQEEIHQWHQRFLQSQVSTEVYSALEEVEKTARQVNTELLFLAGLSEAEGSVAGNTASKRSRTESEAEARPGPQAEPQIVYNKILDDADSIDLIFRNIAEKSSQQSSDAVVSEARLQALVKCLDKHLEESTILKPSAANYKETVLAAVKALRLKIDKKNVNPTQEELVVPGPWACEREGTQVWLQCAIQCIGECLEPLVKEGKSPHKNSLLRETSIPPTQLRPKRIIDFTLQKEGRWNALSYDDILLLPIEAKPFSRKSRGPEALFREGEDQILSHLAKSLYVGFNFARVGVPCHATGVIATMATVKVMHLRYENVGTGQAKLVLYQSKILPLMSLASYRKWAAEAGKPDDVETLEVSLYGNDGKGGMDESGVPKGIRLLFNLMQTPSEKLRGLTVESQNDELGPQLGSGSTAVVFRRQQPGGGVVKVSRYGWKSDIENEMRVLKELAAGSNKNDHIPRLVNESNTIKVTLGHVKAELPAIRTRPEGKPAALVFSNKGTDCCVDDDLKMVCKGVSSALKYMHEKKIYHLDVTPKNIIIVDGGKQAVLIDFSLAHKLIEEKKSKTKKIKGFRGTPNYAHRAIFLHHLKNRQGWTPASKHDFAGLGFSLAYFANHSVRSWCVDGYPAIKATDEDKAALGETMNERFEAAQTAIKDRVNDITLKEEIVKLLSLDKE